MDYAEFYESNEAFRKYVDKYCEANKVTRETALSHKHVKIVAGYYREREEDERNIIQSEGNR